MKKVVAAIYLPGKSDPYFHASMSCTHGHYKHTRLEPSMARITNRYRVMQVWDVVNLQKVPCPDCWSVGGYDALNDIVAERG